MLKPSKMNESELACTPVKRDDDARLRDSVVKNDDTKETDHADEKANVSMCCRFLQFMIPLASILGGSLIAPVANSIPPAKLPGSKANKGFILSTWRFGPMFVIVLAVLPFYALYLYFTRPDEPEQSEKQVEQEANDEDESEQPSTLKIISVLLFIDTCQLMFSASLTALSFFTVMSHLYLLTNLHGVLTLVCSMMCCGLATHRLEKIGIFFLLAGATIMMFDPSAIKNGQQINIVANLLCLLVNIPFALFFIGNAYLKKHLSIPFLISQGITFNFTFSSLMAIFVEGASLNMSDKGVFGFLRQDTWLISFTGNLATFFGIYGYVWALKYFSPVFVMNCLLVEPVVSQVIGVALGIDEWPGWMTWVGVIIVSAAINMIYQGELSRDQLNVGEENQEAQNEDEEVSAKQATAIHKVDVELAAAN